eukprot:CAMPEP_0183456368 /NCGR_PEP_ID=MMETSP0370-20130417/128851_1 /TAXON_ID=268820 /ORGANISM="Peridinium aciculiferum, Strain PAER-2" /LENGTH=37 /DNA_ID= /DNA_START= /DNA_END= /DNA_ORIENTATION=
MFGEGPSMSMPCTIANVRAHCVPFSHALAAALKWMTF